MKWAYSIQQKFRAAALLAVVCLLILFTNYLSKRHMDELSTSFSSVYEDRLVVESYIYRISDHLYQKKLAIDQCAGSHDSDLDAKISPHNEAISGLLLFYEQTLLTEEEAACLQDFKANVAAIRDLELQYLQSPAGDEARKTATLSLLNERFTLASDNLRRLSQIQVKEGKALNEQSQRIAQGSSLLTNLEMIILFGIAILLQVIVAASRPAVSRTWQQSNLN